MTLTSEIIERIKAAVFPYITNGTAEKRIAAVYGDIMKHVKSADKDAVIAEIIEWEKVWAKDKNHDLMKYAKVADEMKLVDYSEIAIYFARKRLASPDDSFLLPYYVSKAFTLFSIDTKGSPFWQEHARLASDTGIDLLYAAGKTQSLSMRLRDWQR